MHTPVRASESKDARKFVHIKVVKVIQSRGMENLQCCVFFVSLGNIVT